jgi:hypothetical protein
MGSIAICCRSNDLIAARATQPSRSACGSTGLEPRLRRGKFRGPDIALSEESADQGPVGVAHTLRARGVGAAQQPLMRTERLNAARFIPHPSRLPRPFSTLLRYLGRRQTHIGAKFFIELR